MALKSKWLLTKTKSYSCPMPGVFRAVGCAAGVVVIFHSPRGCAQIASTMDIGAQYRNIADGAWETMDAVPVISSNLREKDTIFGGADRLARAIRYAVDTYHPRCLVIAVSCVAGIIGDDVAAAAEDAEAEFGIPVLVSEAAGFLGGEYGAGYGGTAKEIVRRFCKPQPHVPGRVLILGDQMGPWAQYATEVRGILEGFGLDARWQFPGYAPFDEWAELPSASLTVRLGGMGQTNAILTELGELFEKDFGVPMLPAVYPIGWENTRAFIRAVAETVGDAARGEALIAGKEKEIEAFVSSVRHVTAGKRAVIGIGRDSAWYDPTDTIRTVLRLGLSLSAVILYDNLPEKEKDFMTNKTRALTDAPLLTMEEGQAALADADIFLTTNEMLEIKTRQLFIPMVSLVGADGEMRMLCAIYRLLCRYGTKGGIAYV